ncbi:MAG: PEGA domain-containing protein [Euryarchaeota archaeon]|nr:PEGA domain-containing protein [Euryarchaeota archaeon]
MKSKKIGLVVLAAILAIAAFSVIPTPVSAQPVEVWNVTWPGFGTAVATTEDSVYLAGVNTNLTDAFLNEYDKDGNLLWNITWEMFAPEVGGSNVVATAAAGDSAYLAGGCAFSNVTDFDAFLNKYDKDGNLLWNITWGGMGGALASATAATEDCVYVAGETAPSNVTDFDAFLNKYDKDGNLLWNITWGGPAGTYSADGAATSGDGVYVAGRAPGGNFSIGGKTFLNRYNSTDGNLLWNITEGGILHIGIATIATGDNAVYRAGKGYTVPGAFLNKYDSTDGSLIWNITWGGIGTSGLATATSGDSVYLAGQNVSRDFDFCTAFLNKYNGTDGSLIWNITWGKTVWVTGRAIATSGDGVVYLAGSKTNENVAPIFANESDAFLVKFSEPTPIPKPTPTPIPATGSISVSSSPSGARATIDRLNWVGSTPCKTPSDLPSGSYTLRLSLEGYQDWSQTVEVKANETSEVHATLTPAPTPTPPGFEAGLAIAGLLAVAYLVLRRRK